MPEESLRHALSLLPAALREGAERLVRECGEVEEIRLRAGQRLTLASAGRERPLSGLPPVTAAQLRQVLENATRSSLHSAAESLRQGYVTSAGGCRVGVCGTAAVTGGEVSSLREISSLNIRVARAHPGIAGPLLGTVYDGARLYSTLLISPPGCGKTTLLRDLVRLISDRGVRVGIADERGEIAASSGGAARFDVGAHSDVLTGAPKSWAVMALLRTMSPQLIALDEISEEHDARAVELAANCGTAILASVHGTDGADVLSRPVFSRIAARGIFRRAIVIRMEEGRRRFSAEAFGG